jgi:hypothetical protein
MDYVRSAPTVRDPNADTAGGQAEHAARRIACSEYSGARPKFHQKTSVEHVALECRRSMTKPTLLQDDFTRLKSIAHFSASYRPSRATGELPPLECGFPGRTNSPEVFS